MDQPSDNAMKFWGFAILLLAFGALAFAAPTEEIEEDEEEAKHELKKLLLSLKEALNENEEDLENEIAQKGGYGRRRYYSRGYYYLGKK